MIEHYSSAVRMMQYARY